MSRFQQPPEWIRIEAQLPTREDNRLSIRITDTRSEAERKKAPFRKGNRRVFYWIRNYLNENVRDWEAVIDPPKIHSRELVWRDYEEMTIDLFHRKGESTNIWCTPSCWPRDYIDVHLRKAGVAEFDWDYTNLIGKDWRKTDFYGWKPL